MGYNSASPKPIGQLPARPVKPGFDRPFWTVHHIRDFGATEILLIKQQKAETVIVPQLANGRLQFIGKIPRGIGVGGDRLIEVQGSAGGNSGPLCESRPTAIGGNRQNPRF
jgi:hypothetical protein